MKKIVLSFILTLTILISVPAFAVEVTPPTGQVPITTTKATNNKDIVVNTNPPNCPMLQGGQGIMNGNCPMTQGNVFYKQEFNNPQGKIGPRIMKFRMRQNGNRCFIGKPGIFRWIGMGIKLIAFLLFWILLIVLLVMLIKWAMKPHHFTHCFKNNSSMDILNERLAKGEITTEQYDELKAKLS